MENIEIRNIPVVENIIFSGKQNIPWKCVEKYLKSYVGLVVKVEEYQDKIVIAGNFPDEYTGSKYTKSLRGAVAKAKANAVQVIEPMIQYATNRDGLKTKVKNIRKMRLRAGTGMILNFIYKSKAAMNSTGGLIYIVLQLLSG